jgi:hypothetical protein
MHLAKSFRSSTFRRAASTRNSLRSPVVTEAASQSAQCNSCSKMRGERWLFAFEYSMSITLTQRSSATLHHRGYMAMRQERQSPSQSCLLPFHHFAANTAGALRFSDRGVSSSDPDVAAGSCAAQAQSDSSVGLSASRFGARTLSSDAIAAFFMRSRAQHEASLPKACAKYDQKRIAISQSGRTQPLVSVRADKARSRSTRKFVVDSNYA